MNQNKNRFAVVGHPIGHTMSPFIHERLFALNGRTAEYGVLDIPPEKLQQSMETLSGLSGFNITIPHKQSIIPYLDAVEEKAACFGSVNTVKNENGRLTGYTTDGAGFRRALQAAGKNPEGRVVILGAGGAARALAFEAALCGARLTVAAREHSLPAAQRLCKDLTGKIPGAEADFCPLDRIPGQMDLLANATPAGMYPHTEECPVSEEVVRSAACVFDAVYNPAETQLLRLARKNGVPAVGGMSMLVWQAAAAHEIWYGAHFYEDDMARLCAGAALEMKKKFGNLVLCGFMGCGKTTVGKILAKKTGRTFVDMDLLIEQNEGMTVAEIFARQGEARFRQLEKEAAASLSRNRGFIIATGGGTLLDTDNTALLKENGVVVLLDAGLAAIRARLAGSTTRPLLAGADHDEALRRLYAQRIGAYRAAADYVVPADGAPGAVMRKILVQLGLV